MRKDRNRISRLRHRVALQRPDRTMGEGGYYSIAWQDIATVWADIAPLKHRGLTAEAVFAEQLVAQVSHEVTMRYRAGVSAEMRMLFDGRYFNIRSVVNVDERGEWLRLLVEENVAV